MGRGKAQGGVVNGRAWVKAWVVSPFMGRDVCPGQEPDCLKPAGTGVGVAPAYTIRIQLETGQRRVAEANAGTQEQERELALAYMWQIHMETGPRSQRVAEAITGTAQIHCGRGLSPVCCWWLALSFVFLALEEWKA